MPRQAQMKGYDLMLMDGQYLFKGKRGDSG
jgi:hypothetical protein